MNNYVVFKTVVSRRGVRDVDVTSKPTGQEAEDWIAANVPEHLRAEYRVERIEP